MPSEFLQQVLRQAHLNPDVPAFVNSSGQQLTYGQLAMRSNALAAYLLQTNSAKAPVVLLGHKHPDMLTGMFASMRAGCAYVPLDTSFPVARCQGIVDQLDNPVVLCLANETVETLNNCTMVSFEDIQTLAAEDAAPVADEHAISGEDAQYIIFTSGSTGAPKGVVQPARSMDHTYRYFSRFIPSKEECAGTEHLTFFNKAHFSFDLSLFDFVIALPFGHTMFALTEDTEASLAASFEVLQQKNPHLWVSTPSYLNMCLMDSSFSADMLSNLRSIVVCGETLYNTTAAKCLERFPKACLYNTYGPTEAQGAITDVQITSDLANASGALPVGTISPFNELQIVDIETREQLPAGKVGEVCILGSTIATGYYGRPDLTQEVFGKKQDSAGQTVPFYLAGDEGYLDDEGMLHFRGRLDHQVKVNGYRIELGEIEETLNKHALITASCVVPVFRGEVTTALAAHVAVAPEVNADRQLTKQLKADLANTLPSYMIPRTFSYHDKLPENANGKIDRKMLIEQSRLA